MSFFTLLNGYSEVLQVRLKIYVYIAVAQHVRRYYDKATLTLV